MELLYVERSVVIRNKGSIEFSEEEQSSDIVLVDIKCDAINGTIYYNTKTLPPYGFYGSVTLFGGATVRERISLEFVYQRVIDFETDYRRLRCYLTKLEDMLQSIGNAVIAPLGVPPVGDGEPRDSFDYRGLPYSKLKINSERLAQYTVTVRSYKEQDVQCQSTSRSDDPTNGEPEYPTPLPIPPDGQFPAGLPNPDAPYPGADPNDFPESNAGGGGGGGATIQGVGMLTFEFLRAGRNEFWRLQQNSGIGYPGEWINSPVPPEGAVSSVSWRDIAGTITELVNSNESPIRTRNTVITFGNQESYTPLSPNFLSN